MNEQTTLYLQQSNQDTIRIVPLIEGTVKRDVLAFWVLKQDDRLIPRSV